jgi:hypothetical protein
MITEALIVHLRIIFKNYLKNIYFVIIRLVKKVIRHKKKPVVPVSYREKIGVSRSEINFFLNIFFMVLAFFCWAICSRVPTSILTRDAYFL